MIIQSDHMLFLGSVRCGGTGLPQASDLLVSLPFRRAIARLVPSVCGTVPPREGGPHVRIESSYRASCHGEAASLVIGCAVDPTLFCGLLYLSFELLI